MTVRVCAVGPALCVATPGASKLLESSYGRKFQQKQIFQTPIYSSLELVTVQLPKIYFQAESVDFRFSGTILLVFLKLNCSVT